MNVRADPNLRRPARARSDLGTGKEVGHGRAPKHRASSRAMRVRQQGHRSRRRAVRISVTRWRDRRRRRRGKPPQGRAMGGCHDRRSIVRAEAPGFGSLTVIGLSPHAPRGALLGERGLQLLRGAAAQLPTEVLAVATGFESGDPVDRSIHITGQVGHPGERNRP